MKGKFMDQFANQDQYDSDDIRKKVEGKDESDNKF